MQSAPPDVAAGRESDMTIKYYVDKGTDTFYIPNDCKLVRFSGQNWIDGQRGRRVIYAAVLASTEVETWGHISRECVREVYATHGAWRTVYWPAAQVQDCPVDFDSLKVYDVCPPA